MEIRAQRSDQTTMGGGVVTYADGSRAAILFLRAGNDRDMQALTQVFRMHDALIIDVTTRAPHFAQTSGECVISPESATVSIRAASTNSGRELLGLELTVHWGSASEVWVEAALERGIWAGLVTEENWQRIHTVNALTESDRVGRTVHLTNVPPMPVLKLDARCE